MLKTEKTSSKTIDKVHNIIIETSKYNNECNTLDDLLHGLTFIYNIIKKYEIDKIDNSEGRKIFSIGRTEIDDNQGNHNMLPCLFHWFGVSICNYARLAGYIVMQENNTIKKEHLEDANNYKMIKDACNEYVHGIDEMKEVIKWRNKIAAHYAITDPRKEDNIATLEASIIFPVSFRYDKFITGGYNVVKGNQDEKIFSEIPQWSVTKLFEDLENRFWTLTPINED